MTTKITKIPFHGTPEQKQKLMGVIAAHKDQQGAMMPILQEAQEIYGYLPIEVQKMIADGLGCPLEQVYGVSTFYSQFTLEPKGEHVARVCLGTACYVRGGKSVLDAFKKKLGIDVGETTPDRLFTLEVGRCFGACGMAPVVMVNDDVHQRVKPSRVGDLVAKLVAEEAAASEKEHA